MKTLTLTINGNVWTITKYADSFWSASSTDHERGMMRLIFHCPSLIAVIANIHAGRWAELAARAEELAT